MIEPEFFDNERLLLIQNYEPDIDDSVYDRLAAQQEQDTQRTSFNDASTQQDEMPTRRPISNTHDRPKTDMIESLFRHMGWEIDESLIELHLENCQTILSFKSA